MKLTPLLYHYDVIITLSVRDQRPMLVIHCGRPAYMSGVDTRDIPPGS